MSRVKNASNHTIKLLREIETADAETSVSYYGLGATLAKKFCNVTDWTESKFNQGILEAFRTPPKATGGSSSSRRLPVNFVPETSESLSAETSTKEQELVQEVLRDMANAFDQPITVTEIGRPSDTTRIDVDPSSTNEGPSAEVGGTGNTDVGFCQVFV
jgi:hypothetical protein